LSDLGKTRLLRRNVTPLLDHWLLDLPGVGSGPGAHLLGNINTLLSGGQLGDKFGDMFAGSLGFQVTFFLGSILDHSLGLVITFLSSLFESTTSRGTEFSGLLGTASDGGVLLDRLLRDGADLLGPLRAFSGGGVSRCLGLTDLLILSFTVNNIILNFMNLLLGPALRLILSSTDLRSLHITILHQGSSTDLNCLIKGDLFILDETTLPEVLLTLLFLLGLVVGDIGGVAPLVIRVVTLLNIIILSLFHHLYFVNTFLTIRTRGSSSYSTKADISVISSLSVNTSLNTVGSMMFVMFIMVGMMVFVSSSIEWEGVHQRLLSSGKVSSISTETAGSKDTMSSNEENNERLSKRRHVWLSLQV